MTTPNAAGDKRPGSLQATLDRLADGYCALDPQWRLTELNLRAFMLMADVGAWREGLLGQSLWPLLSASDRARIEPRCRAAMQDQLPLRFEHFFTNLNGWFEVRGYPSPEGMIIRFEDIGQRTAGAATSAQLPMPGTPARARLGDWRWNAASDRITLRGDAATLFGLAADTALDWEHLLAPLVEADRAPLRGQFLHAWQARASAFHIECRIARTGREHDWIALSGRIDYTGQDTSEPLGLRGMVRDIDERDGACQVLRQSEQVLRALADSLPQLAWIAQADGAIVWFNQRWYDYTGARPAQAIGWGWQSAIDPDTLPQLSKRWQQAIDSGSPFEMEFPLRGADGQYRWFLGRASALRDRCGEVVSWFGTNTDVDQVKRVEQALRDESKVLELLNSTGSALAAQRDLHSLLRTVTEAATRISGARFGYFFYQPEHDADAPLEPASMAPADAPRACAEQAARALGPGVLRSDDVGADPRYGAQLPRLILAPGQARLRSYLAVAVIARGGDMLGLLLLGHPEPAIFNARSERLLGAIAAQASVAIDNMRLYEAARHAADERKQLLERERSARAQAERTSQTKDDFLANLSHELRTPMSAILGWVQVLQRGDREPAELRRGLQVIERNARAQAHLIEDLLDMNRITSGKVLLEMEALAPQGCIEAAIETVRPAADAKTIRIETCFQSGCGLIAGDPARLQQVFWNLLSNAIKFTARGGWVRIVLQPCADQVEVAIEDNGAGIEAEFIDHVFERFRQGASAHAGQQGGLGLGLSIVKHLIELHGGTVRVTSGGERRGARFSVLLPRADPPLLAVLAARARARGAGSPLAACALAGVRVLVVDAERDVRDLIAHLLSDCQAQVRTAADAAEAMSACRQAPPQLLISGLGLDDGDGDGHGDGDVDSLGLLAQVSALAPRAAGALAAIALSRMSGPEAQRRARAAGFATHLSKPVEPGLLMAAVAALAITRGN
jgi:PAS domain S-box-containing protein